MQRLRISPRWMLTGVVAVLLALVGWGLFEPASDDAGGAPAAGQSGSGGAGRQAVAGPAGAASSGAGPFSASGLASRQQQLALWQQRYDRAEQVYSSYRDATRYPHDSRPLAEHPDQVRPYDPIAEDKVLRDASGKAVDGVRLRTTQERVFLSGADSVKFTIAAEDRSGNPVPLVINRSAAQSVPDTTAQIVLIQASVPFADDGQGPDAQAGDGQYSGRLTPAAQGFARQGGTIRVLVDMTANGQAGVAQFEVVYTPAVPATWAGSVREAVEGGSLNFYVKANVLAAGRYVVSGRVFDANGRALALVQFNELMPAGAGEFRLQVFGALILDRRSVFPLRLVDVDGFLLLPDTFPDRAMMPRQPGTVHVSSRYAPDSFSAAEWSSQERDRYLNEYGRDVREALEQVNRLK